MMKLKVVFLFALLTTIACDDNNPVMQDPKVQSLPTQFRMVAAATKTENGINLTCQLDFIFDLTGETFRDPQRVVYQGTQGGHASRSLLDDGGAGFVFSADTFGEVEAHLDTATGQTEILIPINDTSPNRFWKNMARFDAVFDSNGNATGNWVCAPLDIDQEGYVDNTITANGTFQITPL